MLDLALFGATRKRLEECTVTCAEFENASFRADQIYQGRGQRRRRLDVIIADVAPVRPEAHGQLEVRAEPDVQAKKEARLVFRQTGP